MRRRGYKRDCSWLVKHGHASDANRSRAYNVWLNMRQRCENPRHPNYTRYGGRGIKVCRRWKRFENFLEDMGEPSARRSLERVDNAKGYAPGNCRWATPTEQMFNTRRNRLLTLNGRTQPLKAWARELRISHITLRGRIVDGKWTVREALTTPVAKKFNGVAGRARAQKAAV